MRKTYLFGFFASFILWMSLFWVFQFLFHYFDMAFISPKKTMHLFDGLAIVFAVVVTQKLILKNSVLKLIRKDDTYFNLYMYLAISVFYLALIHIWAFSQKISISWIFPNWFETNYICSNYLSFS
jgi:hypothetical protein